MSNVFKFKKFEVDQTGCAMKINTDGVLLGAIVGHAAPIHILDIGTGTGVIALMLAQRYPKAKIDAVEIDDSAAAAAERNCLNTAFSDNITVHHRAIEKYDTDTKYQLIVSNPPYFINDLKSADKRKELARHADEDFFALLLQKVAGMLAEDGLLWLVLPVKQAEKVIVNAVLFKLFPSKIIRVYSDHSKTAFRHIICLGFKSEAILHEDFYIYESQAVYTSQYKAALKDFLLAF